MDLAKPIWTKHYYERFLCPASNPDMGVGRRLHTAPTPGMHELPDREHSGHDKQYPVFMTVSDIVNFTKYWNSYHSNAPNTVAA